MSNHRSVLVLFALVALGGCPARAPASGADAPVPSDTAATWLDLGAYCHSGQGFDAGRPDVPCHSGLDLGPPPDVKSSVPPDVEPGDGEAGPDICPPNTDPGHCDPGPVMQWCECSSVWALGLAYLPCGEVDCKTYKEKDCQLGCVVLCTGEGICREDASEECLGWPAGPTSIQVTKNGQTLKETLTVEGVLGGSTEGTISIATASGDTYAFFITTPATWTLGLPDGATAEARVHCCSGTGKAKALYILDAQGSLRLGLGTQATSSDPLLADSIKFRQAEGCGRLWVLRFGEPGVSIPIGNYRDVLTPWGMRRVWNTSVFDGYDVVNTFAITLPCKVRQ